jgi:Zn-dependent membrane protease YugP
MFWTGTPPKNWSLIRQWDLKKDFKPKFVVKKIFKQYTIFMNWEIVYIISGILILPVLIWGIVAGIRVDSVFNKYKKIDADSGLTARELAEKIARDNGLNIRVVSAGGFLGDHYDPKKKVVALSREVMNSRSIAALAIAAHECGHAMQDKENYFPLRTRNFVIALSNFASRLLMPLIIISIIASIFLIFNESFVGYIMIAMCAIYGLSALVNLITLPTEFDASRRAKEMLNKMQITEDEVERQGVRRVLSAAAQTYVAALAISLLYFFRVLLYVVLVFGRRD